jgi:hypothetical protein
MFESDILSNRRRWQVTRLSRRVRHRLRIGWRRLLSSRRALPDFIIIGAQKSGTSSLYAQLAAHPHVLGASWKEVHFFDNHFSRGASWYRLHFPCIRQLEHQPSCTGEATPGYLFHPRAAERIAEVVPDAKLIALLRNPVDRAISNYWHEVERGREHLPLEEALAAEGERLRADEAGEDDDLAFGYHHRHYAYTRRGLYAEQLKRYDRYFEGDQLLVLKSEDFFSDVQATFDRVARHLGLAPHALPRAEPRNTGSYPEAPPAVRQRLEAFFRPHNRALYDFVGVSEPWW